MTTWGVGVGAYRVLDSDRTGHDQLGVGPYRLVVDSLLKLRGRNSVADPLDSGTLVGTQEEDSRRIGEAAGRDEPVRGGATLADQHRSTAWGQSLPHRFPPSGGSVRSSVEISVASGRMRLRYVTARDYLSISRYGQ
jgi:hypothetical protein